LVVLVRTKTISRKKYDPLFSENQCNKNFNASCLVFVVPKVELALFCFGWKLEKNFFVCSSLSPEQSWLFTNSWVRDVVTCKAVRINIYGLLKFLSIKKIGWIETKLSRNEYEKINQCDQIWRKFEQFVENVYALIKTIHS
jgi:uncharacterized CHY-type Zn-finger protein